MVSRLSREKKIKVVDRAKHTLAAECLRDQLEEMDLNNEGMITIPYSTLVHICINVKTCLRSYHPKTHMVLHYKLEK